jgi:hypothetical protein
MTLHPGDCVHLASDENLYQVIGVDVPHDRCWVRRWPLARHGSPVFEISLQQVEPSHRGGALSCSYPVGRSRS